MTSVLIDQIKYSLQDLEKDLWLRLLNGSLRSKASFHTGQIATLGNEWPEIRTVERRRRTAPQRCLSRGSGKLGSARLRRLAQLHQEQRQAQTTRVAGPDRRCLQPAVYLRPRNWQALVR